jgi:hypothetical protein
MVRQSKDRSSLSPILFWSFFSIFQSETREPLTRKFWRRRRSSESMASRRLIP